MKKYLIPALLVLVLITGCRSRKPVAPTFYIIEFPADKQITDTLTPLNFTLEIADVDVFPAYASNQIAQRDENDQISYFAHHQWASRPQQSFERFALAYFSRHNVFSHSGRRFWNVQPDFRLFISIHNLEVVRDRNDLTARLHLEFRLESASGEVIERHISDSSRLLERRNLGQFTRAVNKMFYEELNFFARKIHFLLSPA